MLLKWEKLSRRENESYLTCYVTPVLKVAPSKNNLYFRDSGMAF